MILVLGNFAGVFSNLCKFLTWSLTLNDEDILLFYYTNKNEHNDTIRVLPFQNYGGEIPRIFFYKYFEYPSGCSAETFLERDKFEMAYPLIPKESLPSYLQQYENGFIFCTPTLFFDPFFPLIRSLYHKQIQKRLQFTPLMNSFIQPELQRLQSLQSQGKKILAVFLRSTTHFGNYNVDGVFHEIKEISQDYDYILPITQIGPFLQRAIQEFGDKCILLPRRYTSHDIDWISLKMSDKEYEEEFRNVIADVYLASQCDCIMGGSSNMFLGALFFNPTVPYKVFQELKGKDGM